MKFDVEISDEVMKEMPGIDGMKFTGKFELRAALKGDVFKYIDCDRWNIAESDHPKTDRNRTLIAIFTPDPAAKHKADFKKWVEENDVKVGDTVKVLRSQTVDVEVELNEDGFLRVAIPGYGLVQLTRAIDNERFMSFVWYKDGVAQGGEDRREL